MKMKDVTKAIELASAADHKKVLRFAYEQVS